MHYEIALHMTKNKSFGVGELFSTMSHFMVAKSLIVDNHLKNEVIELSIQAGKAGKKSLAYKEAIEVLEFGISFLPENPFETLFDPTFRIYNELALCECLDKNLTRSAELFDLITSHTTNPLHKVEVLMNKSLLHGSEGLFAEYVEAALDVLSLFGYNIKLPVSSEDIMKQVEKVNEALGDRPISSLAKQEKVCGEEQAIVSSLLNSLIVSSYFVSVDLLRMLMALQVWMSLTYGSTKADAHSFPTYGWQICGGVLKDYNSCYEWGKLTVQMGSGSSYGYCGLMIFGGLISYLKEPEANSVEYLEEASRLLLSVGDISYAAYASMQAIIALFWSRQPLNKVYEKSKKFFAVIQRLAIPDTVEICEYYIWVVKSFLGERVEETEPEIASRLVPEGSSDFKRGVYHVVATYYYFICDDLSMALKNAELATEHTEKLLLGFRDIPHYKFYYALTLLGLMKSSILHPKAGKREGYLSRVKSLMGELRLYVDCCPPRFGHLYKILEADLLCVQFQLESYTDSWGLANQHIAPDNVAKIYNAYHEASLLAETGGYVRELSVVKELTYKFMCSTAAHVKNEACYCYGQYAASEKQMKLANTCNFPAFGNTFFSVGASSHLSSQDQPINAVFEASEFINENSSVEELITNIISIMTESTSATKGCLLLVGNNQLQETLFIRTVTDVDDDLKKYFKKKKKSEEFTEAIDYLPRDIINYCWRSKTDLFWNQGEKQTLFGKDPYIIKHQPASILCFLVNYKAENKGLIYLENRHFQTFSPQQIKTLQVLVHQLMVSYENAILLETLEENNKLLLKKNKELKQVDKVKDSLLAMVSHEFKTPLNGILGTAALMLEEPSLTADQRECVSDIKSSCSTLTKLVNSILDFSKLRAGKVDLAPEKFSIVSCADACIKVLSQHLPNTDINIAYFIDKNVPYYLFADNLRIQQIIINLLNNAVKFTESGDIILTFNCERSLSDSNGTLTLVVSVADPGIGIAEEKQQELFKPFSQLDNSYSRDYEGTGLGLSICKFLASIMGGKIWLESKEGKGSTFYFTVPQLPIVWAKKPQEPPFIIDATVILNNYPNQLVVTDLLASHNAFVKTMSCEEYIKEEDRSQEQENEIDLLVLDLQSYQVLKNTLEKTLRTQLVVLLLHPTIKQQLASELCDTPFVFYFPILLPLRHASFVHKIQQKLKAVLPHSSGEYSVSEIHDPSQHQTSSTDHTMCFPPSTKPIYNDNNDQNKAKGNDNDNDNYNNNSSRNNDSKNNYNNDNNNDKNVYNNGEDDNKNNKSVCDNNNSNYNSNTNKENNKNNNNDNDNDNRSHCNSTTLYNIMIPSSSRNIKTSPRNNKNHAQAIELTQIHKHSNDQIVNNSHDLLTTHEPNNINSSTDHNSSKNYSNHVINNDNDNHVTNPNGNDINTKNNDSDKVVTSDENNNSNNKNKNNTKRSNTNTNTITKTNTTNTRNNSNSKTVDFGTQPKQLPTTTATVSPRPLTYKGMKVLVVEDNPLNRKIMGRVLSRRGFTCCYAYNGEEAVSKFLSGEENYDLILMDLHMPKMDGFAATKLIREKEEKERHTPIMAVTASCTIDDRQLCKEAGMDGFCLKPLNFNAFFAELDKLFKVND